MESRVVHEEMVQRYSAVLTAANALRDFEVWPSDSSTQDSPLPPTVEYQALLARAGDASLFGSPEVNNALNALLAAALNVTDRIEVIRTRSTRGHRGKISQRELPYYTAMVTELNDAITAFCEAARADLGITSGFVPIRPPEEAKGPNVEDIPLPT